MNRNNALQTISVLKVVCMFLVVAGHSCAAYVGIGWGGSASVQISRALTLIFGILSMIHTQAFTYASGYLFSYNRNCAGKYRDRRQSIMKRFRRLMIPYFAFTLLWGIPAAVIFEKASLIRIIKDFILASNPAQYWFLVMLFVLYIVFFELNDWVVKNNPWVIAVFAFCVHYAASVLSRIFPIGYFGIANILRYSVFFCFGVLAERHKLQPIRGVSTLVVFIIEGTLYALYQIVPKVQFILYPFISILGILLLHSFCAMLANRTDLVKSKGFEILASSSMGVYLLHQQIIYALMRVTNQQAIIPVIGAIMNFSASILVSIILVRGLRYTKTGRMLLGE